jgi:Ni,Fe-hydrogenase I cytochrome b subunit
MKKFIVLVILLIITGLQMYSQKSRDVLYLKNGSIIYGTVVEISDNQYKSVHRTGAFLYFQVRKLINMLKRHLLLKTGKNPERALLLKPVSL